MKHRVDTALMPLATDARNTRYSTYDILMKTVTDKQYRTITQCKYTL